MSLNWMIYIRMIQENSNNQNDENHNAPPQDVTNDVCDKETAVNKITVTTVTTVKIVPNVIC
jgi:hypothetical protein